MKLGRAVIGGVIACAAAMLLTSCTKLPTVSAESPDGMYVEVEMLAAFDGLCGVGVRVSNTGTEPLTFAESDDDVFEGPSLSWKWEDAFNEAPSDVEGYDIERNFPRTLEAGDTVTTGFVVHCDTAPAIVIVHSTNSDDVKVVSPEPPVWFWFV